MGMDSTENRPKFSIFCLKIKLNCPKLADNNFMHRTLTIWCNLSTLLRNTTEIAFYLVLIETVSGVCVASPSEI